MIEKTLLCVLTQYKIYVQTSNKLCGKAELSHTIAHIDSCVEYINQGNTVNGAWLENNHTVLSKAVTYAHNSKHFLGNEMDEEHRDLNNFVLFYRKFYEKCGIDPKYMEI